MIKFTASRAETDIIFAICERAEKLTNGTYSHMDVAMDIEAAHCNGNPLKLDKLLAADDFNFAHDVFGIRRHLNRETGALNDCFSPRFSV